MVAFSRKDIFSIKREIESKTPHKCCIIYGSLPQETRAHQVKRRCGPCVLSECGGSRHALKTPSVWGVETHGFPFLRGFFKGVKRRHLDV